MKCFRGSKEGEKPGAWLGDQLFIRRVNKSCGGKVAKGQVAVVLKVPAGELRSSLSCRID